MKAMVYSVKLKVEFAVLTKMVSVFTGPKSAIGIDGAAPRGEINPEKSWVSHTTTSTTQENLPPSWRLSIDHEKAPEPDLIEIQRQNNSSMACAKDSFEDLYPGRLG